MDEITRRFERMMDQALMGAMTSNVAAPSEALTADKLMASLSEMLAMPPAPPPVRIVESVHMVDLHEDWSKVRSPSRTRRRMRYNAARIFTYTPKKEAFHLPSGEMVMHPEMAKLLRNQVSR